jgi:hypothetical protein
MIEKSILKSVLDIKKVYRFKAVQAYTYSFANGFTNVIQCLRGGSFLMLCILLKCAVSHSYQAVNLDGIYSLYSKILRAPVEV